MELHKKNDLSYNFYLNDVNDDASPNYQNMVQQMLLEYNLYQYLVDLDLPKN